MSTTHRFPTPQAQPSATARKPDWLRVRMPQGEGYERVKTVLKQTQLATVCQEAR
jgi:lipoic acid synthetase